MLTYLYHISLDSGEIKRSLRSEVSDAIIADLRPHLQRAIGNKQDVIPTTMCTLMASATGPFLLGTILGLGKRPILTFGVAPRSRGAAKLWQMLIEGRQFDAEPGDPPESPWLAVRMETGADERSLADWMADYERCIAWAWLEGSAK